MSPDINSTSDDHGRPERHVSFTIDGRQFTVTDAEQTAAGLLHLAGLDPNGYDLGQLHGNDPKPNVYEDSETLHVKDGDRLIDPPARAAVA